MKKLASSRRIHLDFHTPEFLREAVVNFNSKKIAARLYESKVQGVTVFAKDHYGNSYYSTTVGHKHSGIEADMLGELIARCGEYDIEVSAYYSVCTDWHAATEHPDWQQRGEDGKELMLERWKNVCLNSPYLEDLCLPQLEEIVSQYDINGLWLDMVFVLPEGCFCSYCRKKFRQEYGRELCLELIQRESELFSSFKVATLQRAVAKIRERAKNVKPDVTILANGGGSIADFEGLTTLSCRRADGLVDVSAIEAQPGYEGYYYLARQARYAQLLGRPFELINVRFVKRWGEWTIKPVPQLKYETGVMLAAGGIVTLGDQANPDGTLEEGVYKTVKEVFHFLEEREPYLANSEAVADCAVFFQDGLSPHLKGADAICSELNLQYDLIDEKGLSDGKHYKLIIVPEIGELSGQEESELARFVNQGGTLLVSGTGILRDGSQLADLLGVSFNGLSSYSVVYGEPGFVKEPGIPLLIRSRLVEITPVKANQLCGAIYPSCEPTEKEFVSHQYANAGKKTPFPLITCRRYGKGAALYIGTDIFGTYWQTHHWWLREMVRETLKRVKYEPLVKVETEGTVDLFLRRKADEFQLHLLNFHAGKAVGGGYIPLDKIPPIALLRVGVNLDKIGIDRERNCLEVFREPGGETVLLDEQSGGYSWYVISNLGIYEILRLVIAKGLR